MRFRIVVLGLALFACPSTYALQGAQNQQDRSFSVAWVEPLVTPSYVQSVGVGHLRGDNADHLVCAEGQHIDGDGFHEIWNLRAYRWQQGRFQGAEIVGSTVVTWDRCTQLLMVPSRPGPDWVALTDKDHDTDHRLCLKAWRFDGSGYREKQVPVSYAITSVSSSRSPKFAGWYDYNHRYYPFSAPAVLRDDDLLSWRKSATVTKSISTPSDQGACIVEDLDGNGSIETALLPYGHDTPLRLTIYSADGKKLFVSNTDFRSMVAFRPEGSRVTYIAAAGWEPSSLYILQWTGKSCKVVWRSGEIRQLVRCMCIGDPKGEGKDGVIVVLWIDGSTSITKLISD